MRPVCDEDVAQPSGPLFLLDGSNIAYRAFFALPQDIATSSGFPTNALYGFCLMIIKVLSEYRPEAVIVAWDSREKTFRHAEFEEYKAQRKPMPDLLSEQWPYFAEICAAFGFVNLALPGYEADDILGTLAHQAEQEGRDTVIVTGDRDALQLVGETVKVMANTRGVTEVKIYDAAAVEERFGVPPALIPDYIGLKGDSSDNIPGVPGIGEKTAAELLARFGTIEGVLDNVDQVSGAKRKQVLAENRELALLSKKLATIDTAVPIDIEGARQMPHGPERDKLEELFVRFEFTSLMERVEPLLDAPELVEGEEGDQADQRRLAAPVDVSADLAQVQGLLDLDRPVAMAVDPFDGKTLWLAQATPGADPCDYTATKTLRAGEAAAAIELLRDLVPAAQVVCHDLKSDAVLKAAFPHVGHDTYVAAYLLSPGKRSYPLEECARDLGIPSPVCPTASDGEAGAGSARAALLLAVATEQRRNLDEQGMGELFSDIELPLTGVLIDMEKKGIHLDSYRLGEIAGKVQDQIEGLQTLIFELAGDEFNLGSPQQLSHILFDVLGLPPQRKTKTGYSTDAKTLEALRDRHPIVAHLLSHRELSKLMSTYLLALPEAVDPATGRLHTTFNQTVTATGRLSSSDPNLQNIPVRTALGAQIRECFTAPEGRLLVVADYSQIELRIMAHLSQEPALLEALRRGEDIHTRTAAEVFSLAPEEVDDTHRRYAKAVNFGIMYGISAFGLSQNLGIERDEAAEYIDRYFERMPRVKTFIEETIEIARHQGYVATLFGRRRPIPELASGNFQQRSLGERLAVNSVIQGTAADIIKVAMIRCHRRLEKEYPEAMLVLQIHDELVFEAPEAQAEKVRDAMVAEMVDSFVAEPALAVDAGIGRDWLSAK